MRSVLRLYAVLRTSLAALLLAKLQSYSQFTYAASVCPREQTIRPCKCHERSDEIQIWCSYGDLNSIMNSLKLIGQTVPKTVDELILENNLLPSLPSQTFSSLKILRLMLRENGLQRVSANWLSGSETTLQELYIVEPELAAFPDESLVTLPKLEALTLSAGLLAKMPAIFGLSRLRYIQIEASAMSEVAANNFQGLPFLEQLHITSAPKLLRLEEDFIHDLPKLSILNFTGCGLTYIHPRALVRLPALSEISFSVNRFTDARLVGMAVRDLPNLATVRLDGNGISRLEEATFVDIPSLTNLHLNDNNIAHIFRAAFHRLPRLRSLDLSNNEIRVIHPESFLPPRDNIIEELWLNNNRIEHSFTLRMLLDSLPNLRLLDMSNNFLEDLSRGAVQNHLSLEMLILESNKLVKVGRESFVGLPSLRELKLRNNSLAYHIGTPYWNLPALKGLDLSRNNFEHIDRYLLGGLPSLRRFDISHNLLKTVDPATFVGSPFLEHINMSGNHLQLLAPLTFSQLHRLFVLDVSRNNLTRGIFGIPRNVEYLYMSNNNMMVITTATMHEFQLSSLKLLDLSGNKIHDIPGTSLSALCTLRTLMLNDNSLQVIDQHVFENLPQLRVLNLANNKLILIKKNSFRKLAHLNELNLGKNRLEVFEAEILSNNTELKKLDLSGNRLTDLSPNVFASNKKIEELNLSENSLTSFPSTITSIASLQMIDLSGNQLKSIPHNILPTLPALKELRLSGNRLKELGYGVFDKLPQLVMLNVEKNEIEKIGTRALHSLPNLVMVKLAENKITSVAKAAFEDLPMLQSIELQENQLQDIADGAIVSCPNLLMLNLSNNALSGVEKAGLGGLKTLEALDLSHNKISTLSTESVRDLNFLILLKLDNNRLCNIDGTPFEKMFRLRMLSLRDNKMTSLAENTFGKLRSSILYFDIEGNPIKCSCNMLWLQSWLQRDEQHHPGPRCSDGILLKEHKISTHNCDNALESVPGCQVPTPTAPTINITMIPGTAQVRPVSKPNVTMIPGPAQVQPVSKPNSYLKPLPEETDYFDPKFIEYHENTSRLAFQNQTTIPPAVMAHFIPGDTPTLYAGIKPKTNNTKPNVPPQSSSALTFFGMPLPSLNLNNFWNSGKSLEKAKKHGRHESWSITEPDIQKDGFVPVLPGVGGFVPMNTSITDNKNSTPHHVTGHATISKVTTPQKANSEDLFSDLEPTRRPNRNVSLHKPTVQVSVPLSTTRATLNHSESTTQQPELSKTFLNEPVFSVSDRYHGDTNFDDKNFEKSFSNKTAVREKSSKEFLSPSSVSEFLVPAGEMLTSTGRPVVSKVHLNPGPSPHNEDSYSSHLRLAKSSLHTSTSRPTTDADKSRNESNWYFANYNRSNIEPFVGRLPVKTSINLSNQNRPLLPLFYTWLFLFVIL